MKKTILFLVLTILFGSSITAQTKENVARECVLFEVFTGVRCPYCPAAANAIAQLLEEGKEIAPVAYHTRSFSTADYYTSETEARASFYGISSYPTLKADGMLSYVGGGSASESNYSYYINRYNQRVGVSSPFTIDLTYEPGNNGLWTVRCVVNQVGECDAQAPRIFIALTQCNINVSWMGMHGLHHVVRDMIPTQTGTPFTGPSMTVEQTFQMNWPKEDCYLTAWVQNYNGTKEVYQAVRISLDADLDYDLVMKEVKRYSTSICSGLIKPVISVENSGNEEINSFDVVVKGNGTEIVRETWNGTLPQGESVDFGMTEFYKGGFLQLDFEVVQPNGHAEEYAGDNVATISLGEPEMIDGYLKLQIQTDQHPEETMIQIVNMASGEVVHEVTFEQSGHMYQRELSVADAGCYRIRVTDAGGDGITNGLIAFTKTGGGALFYVTPNTDFTDEITFEFYCDGLWSVEEEASASISLYPNPSNGKFFLDLGEGEWQVAVFDIAGRLIHQESHFTKGDIELNCDRGVYFLKATDGEKEQVRKVMVY